MDVQQYGSLQDINDYDLFALPIDTQLEEGIYDVEVEIDNKIYPSKFFYWKIAKDYMPEGFFPRGLVVANDDAESLADATKKYNERTDIL